MKVSELQNLFIEELKTLLPSWKFVKSYREFRKSENGVIWLFHISCVNHTSDFDAVGDVAVEFKSGKERICIVGAELGNIVGSGQHRFPVSNASEAKSSARELFEYFNQKGLPFLERFSNPEAVVDTLKRGGKEALLIIPLLDQHKEQIKQMSNRYGIVM
ncbi:hypothetical protein JYB87_00875 [Shewanella avicenniae]|uniref:Uncharacterized protein n=1 Tax=Shewanella avicenniae TaxID=2814294 RepID=A0ABX7QSD7_9GAMM|nr:hypothetical protein [Shewanella avicenniae]QSX33840.1 hypothetical protein JYB87_00875 [Shewanella avicenniae]